MSGPLPPDLKAGIDRLLAGVSRRDLGRRAAALSAGYRRGDGSAARIATALDVVAYLAVRLPATFAAVDRALALAQLSSPAGWAPASVLDFGAGPGTAAWAAAARWPALARVTLVDASRPFLRVASDLAAGAASPALRRAEIRQDDLCAAAWSDRLPAADLVILAYAMAEMTPADAVAVAARAWTRCRGVLLLVEPGTPAGHRRIQAARAALVADGAAVAAPCPHDRSCPLPNDDWCHFTVRLPRSRDHRMVKRAAVPFEDEPFSFAALARPGLAQPCRARVIRPPIVTKAAATLALCTADGLAERTVARRDKPAWAHARKLRWGDACDDGPADPPHSG